VAARHSQPRGTASAIYSTRQSDGAFAARPGPALRRNHAVRTDRAWPDPAKLVEVDRVQQAQRLWFVAAIRNDRCDAAEASGRSRIANLDFSPNCFDSRVINEPPNHVQRGTVARSTGLVAGRDFRQQSFGCLQAIANEVNGAWWEVQWRGWK
jgi:hypothetical protein